MNSIGLRTPPCGTPDLILVFILLYSFSQANLAFVYLKNGSRKSGSHTGLEHYPMVTIQLPIYNEKYVVGRLIEAIVGLDYPKEKMEIQILDDSNDETVSIVASIARKYQEAGFNLKQIKRPIRIEFKAGALKYGLEMAEGDFVAIFDADFLPEPDF